jgi:hypothetical protein
MSRVIAECGYPAEKIVVMSDDLLESNPLYPTGANIVRDP